MWCLESECPVNCISVGDEIYVIDAEQCIDCGACADVCQFQLLTQHKVHKGILSPFGLGVFFKNIFLSIKNKLSIL